MLVAHLPPESETGLATLGEAAGWSRTDHLLAGIFDLLQTLLWQNANAGARTPSPRPEPLERPGIQPAARGTPRPLAEVRALLPGTAARVEVNDGS